MKILMKGICVGVDFNNIIKEDMCIYYGDLDGLTYEKQEHVIPAGLGCHTKLEKGVVSDQANEYFSSMEREVLEKSVIMVNRVIEGPGKRGKLSEKYMTKSEVSVVCLGGENFLGIMKGTQGYLLSQFVIDNNGVKFIRGTEKEYMSLGELKKQVSGWNREFLLIRIRSRKWRKKRCRMF